LDLVLEVFEKRLDDGEFFAYLIKALGPSSSDICHLLGFKYEIYQARFQNLNKLKGIFKLCSKFQHPTNEIVPTSLYNLSAELIRLGIIGIQELVPHVCFSFFFNFLFS